MGMLEVDKVPGFTGILIHAGNREKDTAGCLLVGNAINNNNVDPAFLGSSTDAYLELYRKVTKAMEAGESVTITYAEL